MSQYSEGGDGRHVPISAFLDTEDSVLVGRSSGEITAVPADEFGGGGTTAAVFAASDETGTNTLTTGSPVSLDLSNLVDTVTSAGISVVSDKLTFDAPGVYMVTLALQITSPLGIDTAVFELGAEDADAGVTAAPTLVQRAEVAPVAQGAVTFVYSGLWDVENAESGAGFVALANTNDDCETPLLYLTAYKVG